MVILGGDARGANWNKTGPESGQGWFWRVEMPAQSPDRLQVLLKEWMKISALEDKAAGRVQVTIISKHYDFIQHPVKSLSSGDKRFRTN
jgi:hypothetical protein